MMTAIHAQRPSRSILCLPGSNDRALAKLSTLDMDSVIFDLEDAVAPSEKAQAREKIASFLSSSPLPGVEKIIRINDLTSSYLAADLALVLASNPDAVLIPKVKSPSDIMEIASYLAEQDAPETIRIWAMMETPLSILNAGAIAGTGRTSGGRLDALVVGLNDLRKDTGVLPDPSRAYLLPWLMQVVLAGRAFGLRIVDAVSNEFRDLSVFEAECGQGRAMGFDGKMLIHPAQIAAANRCFQPSPEDIVAADRIIDAFAKPEVETLNAIDIDGKMVERLHYQQALALKARVQMIAARKAP